MQFGLDRWAWAWAQIKCDLRGLDHSLQDLLFQKRQSTVHIQQLIFFLSVSLPTHSSNLVMQSQICGIENPVSSCCFHNLWREWSFRGARNWGCNAGGFLVTFVNWWSTYFECWMMCWRCGWGSTIAWGVFKFGGVGWRWGGERGLHPLWILHTWYCIWGFDRVDP